MQKLARPLLRTTATTTRRLFSSSDKPPSSLPQAVSQTESALQSPHSQHGLDSTVQWKWLPPPARPVQTLEDEAQGQRNPSVARPKLNTHIPIISKVHVSKEELIESFLAHGASNVLWKPCGSLADAMVFATARSNAHARMLAQIVVKATRDRKLYTFNKYHPIEGVDDWFLVDTGVLMVNLFSGEKKRREVNLEGHLDQLAKHSKDLKEKWGEDMDPVFLQAEIEKLMKVDDLSVPDGKESVPGYKDNMVNYSVKEVEGMERKFDSQPEQERLDDEDEVEEAGGFDRAMEELDKRAKFRKRLQKQKQNELDMAAAQRKKGVEYFTGVTEEQLITGRLEEKVESTSDEKANVISDEKANDEKANVTNDEKANVTNVIRGRRRLAFRRKPVGEDTV
ncbi:hypothetical protein BASA81_002691 [Batrachochytrium salamandrivorans]|nr:hypothetical protein BASA81_002691 [Batrachochytrium salamandrivorans]